MIVVTTFSRKPKFFVDHLLRIIWNGKTFRKVYNHSFTEEIFESSSIQLSQHWTLQCFQDGFTVHVISSASMEISDQNKLASFSNFFNDEIQPSGEWKVALTEIMSTTKTERITKRCNFQKRLNSRKEVGRIRLPKFRRSVKFFNQGQLTIRWIYSKNQRLL